MSAVTHGTHRGYQAGCRCIDCRDFVRDYSARRRNLGHPNGVVVMVRSEALRRIMRERGIDYDTLADAIGAHPSTVLQELKRSRMGLYRLDAIACVLGTHYMLLTDDDCVSADAS